MNNLNFKVKEILDEDGDVLGFQMVKPDVLIGDFQPIEELIVQLLDAGNN